MEDGIFSKQSEKEHQKCVYRKACITNFNVINTRIFVL